MKGQIALEYVFQMLIIVVVILVVVSLIIVFRNQILNYLKICDLLPQFCRSQECYTSEMSEQTIDADALNRYCNSCWDKTGKNHYEKDCLCYIVKGSYSPTMFYNKNCDLKCNKTSSSLVFYYDRISKSISITC